MAVSCAPAHWRRSMKRARCATKAGASSPNCRANIASSPRRASSRSSTIISWASISKPRRRRANGCCAPPHSATFIHRQTMAGAMRFSTNELAELEAKIASAADRALAIELAAFERLRSACLAQMEAIRGLGLALAEIDVACALAELAVKPRLDASGRRRFAELSSSRADAIPSSRRRFARAANPLSPMTPIFPARLPMAAASR